MQRRNRRAGVEDRWRKSDGTPSAANGVGKRWRARYVDDNGREVAKGFARKVEAQAWLDSIISTQVQGTYVDPRRGRMTYREFYSEWSSLQNWVHHTRRAMDAGAVEVPFADIALTDLRRSHIEAWVKELVERPLAPRTVHQRVNNVKTVLKAARRDKRMIDDPIDGVPLPRVRRAEMAMEIPDPAAVGRLVTAAEPSFAAYVAVCAFAGLRRSEAAALQPQDIDFLRKRVSVNRQAIGISSGVVEVRAPKYGSERNVPVSAGLLEILSEHLRVHTPGDDPSRWLFPGLGANPLNGNMVFGRWRKARAAAGVATKLHSLRHYFASSLIAAGCDVVMVQRAMGHSSASITLDTYSHLFPSGEDRTRAAAERAFSEALQSPADGLRTIRGN
ncbi:tyrosine-type recombinase/integrase [Rhodococcoides corynebacterioides]|uniref:Site-specific integrase n=1 Tax=Rhodococcoides corynebacterioides TaxID=53972 RepID=A0ABS7P3W4_9NOCA|nr:site-specific integrase [Rhodococcus corynebacterioides]MBY6367095.1 site-specific integrase [Rhodococcus corynebacterioides]MBY6407356.1 site-specific integrase [Rhodococcus corynebacterioides]